MSHQDYFLLPHGETSLVEGVSLTARAEEVFTCRVAESSGGKDDREDQRPHPLASCRGPLDRRKPLNSPNREVLEVSCRRRSEGDGKRPSPLRCLEATCWR